MKIMFGIQGYFNPILRVSEPAFYQIVSHKIKTSICCRRRDNKRQAELQKKEDKKFMAQASKFLNRISVNLKQTLNGSSSSINEEEPDYGIQSDGPRTASLDSNLLASENSSSSLDSINVSGEVDKELLVGE